MNAVLFVCTANICRSPMAEGLLTAKVAALAAPWQVGSAGVAAQSGFSAAYHTLEVLQKRGIDLHAHRSRPVTPEILQTYPLLLTMEFMHKELLQAVYPQHARKVYLLSEMMGEYREIADPIGLPAAAYEETAQEIETILNAGWDRLVELSTS